MIFQDLTGCILRHQKKITRWLRKVLGESRERQKRREMPYAMTMLTGFSFVRISGREEKRIIGKRGAESVSEAIEKKVRLIYNDCWASYKKYLADHDMAGFNQRVVELQQKYGEERFLRDILYAFAPVINALHAEYLMDKEGKK